MIDLDINLLLKKFSIEIATLIYTGQVHIHLITQGAMRVCTVRICITGKNDHTVKTVPKSNRQIVEIQHREIQHREIDIPNTHIDDRSLGEIILI